MSTQVDGTGAWALVNVVTPRHTVATVGAMQNFGGYFGGSFAPVITGRCWNTRNLSRVHC
jgi:hypothetical protein